MFHGEGGRDPGRSEDRRERHEVSEKVGMREAGMPNPESSDGNFVAAGG